MKAEILMVPLTEAGILRISPETAVEAFALHHWWRNYNRGDYSSIFDCSPAIPAQPQPPPQERPMTDAIHIQPEPAGQLPPDYIDTEHTGIDLEILQAFYDACWSEGGTVDEVTLRGLRAVLARWGNHPGSPDSSGNLKAGLTGSPANGEVAELVGELSRICFDVAPCDADTIARAAELLSQRHPQPVPVSERLPGPEDCIPHPRTKLGNCCWGFGRLFPPPAGLPTAPPVGPRQWTLMYVETIELECSHWLPAHALPLPGEVEHD